MYREVRALFISAALCVTSLPAETVQEIADRIVYARGGRAKLQSIQTERMSGVIVAGGQDGSFVIEVKRPNKIRLEVKLGDSSVIEAFDGKTGRKISSPGQKMPEQIPQSETQELIGDTDIDGPFLDFNAKTTQIEILDKEMLGSSLVWKLKTTLKDGSVSYYYVESTGYLVLLREQLIEKGGQQYLSRQFYQDFQRVQNSVFPLVVISDDGVSEDPTRLKFEKVELNVPEPEDRFTLVSAK